MVNKPKYYRGKFFSGGMMYFYDLFMQVVTFEMEKKIRKKIIEFFPKKPKRILDIACGTGATAIILGKRYPSSKIYAIDLSDLMLGIANKKSKKEGVKIEFSKQNMEKTNFRNNYFDAVTVSIGLHEVLLEKRKNVIKEAHRILKRKGRFVMLDFGYPRNVLLRGIFFIFILLFEPYGKSLLKQDLKKVLKENGFKGVEKKSIYSNMVQIVWGEKL